MNHPNLVRTLRAGTATGYHYFAMEFVEGEDVYHRIGKMGVIPEKEALEIVHQVAMALELLATKRELRPAKKHGLGPV